MVSVGALFVFLCVSAGVLWRRYRAPAPAPARGLAAHLTAICALSLGADCRARGRGAGNEQGVPVFWDLSAGANKITRFTETRIAEGSRAWLKYQVLAGRPYPRHLRAVAGRPRYTSRCTCA